MWIGMFLGTPKSDLFKPELSHFPQTEKLTKPNAFYHLTSQDINMQWVIKHNI